MRVIKRSETVSFSNSSTCSGFEFPFEDKNLNIAVVTVDGRYPDTGHLINEVCEEIAYALNGSDCIGVDDTIYDLSPGDAVMVQPGERFFWQGDKLQMLMPCSPAFYPEQHKEIS
jgi:mannose-6-phosphate isomerase-like protein (cupin superfamily)